MPSGRTIASNRAYIESWISHGHSLNPRFVQLAQRDLCVNRHCVQVDRQIHDLLVVHWWRRRRRRDVDIAWWGLAATVLERLLAQFLPFFVPLNSMPLLATTEQSVKIN